MKLSEFIQLLRAHIQFSEADALWGVLAACFGFVCDSWWFHGGIEQGPVTVLYGVCAIAASKLAKNSEFYQMRVLRRLDRLVSSGHLPEQQARSTKNKIIAIWLRSQVAVVRGGDASLRKEFPSTATVVDDPKKLPR